MKLFVVAALIAMASAGRLEHLERSYLPPDNNSAGSSFGSHSGSSGSFGSYDAGSTSFGGHSGSFGGHSGSFGGHSGSFGANSGFGGHGNDLGFAGASQPATISGAFPSATSNQYLPPNFGTSNNGVQFGSQGLGGQRFGAQPNRYQAAGQRYSIPSTQYGVPAGPSSFSQTRTQPQFGGANQFGTPSRQYLSPNSGSSQDIPQQAFDEETGYHY